MVAGQPCNLCGEFDFEPLAERDRRGTSLATVVCRVCGLVVHGDVPTHDELQQYYTARYREDYQGEYIPSPYRVVREWRRARKLLEQLQADLPRRASVLEIGSGIGCTVMNFALAGHRARGIEPGQGFATYSRTYLNADVQHGTLADLPLVPEYDLVLLVHVLEHLPDPADALTRIGRMLTSRGQVYVEVPNLAGNHAAPGRQFHFAHIYNFTPATLRMLAAKCGYSIGRAYKSPRDKVISYLLSRGNDVSFRLERASYGQTMEALRRYSRLSYYLRVGYLLETGLIRAQQLSERLGARRKLAKILAQCEAHAEQEMQDCRPQRHAA